MSKTILRYPEAFYRQFIHPWDRQTVRNNKRVRVAEGLRPMSFCLCPRWALLATETHLRWLSAEISWTWGWGNEGFETISIARRWFGYQWDRQFTPGCRTNERQIHLGVPSAPVLLWFRANNECRWSRTLSHGRSLSLQSWLSALSWIQVGLQMSGVAPTVHAHIRYW